MLKIIAMVIFMLLSPGLKAEPYEYEFDIKIDNYCYITLTIDLDRMHECTDEIDGSMAYIGNPVLRYKPNSVCVHLEFTDDLSMVEIMYYVERNRVTVANLIKSKPILKYKVVKRESNRQNKNRPSVVRPEFVRAYGMHPDTKDKILSEEPKYQGWPDEEVLKTSTTEGYVRWMRDVQKTRNQ